MIAALLGAAALVQPQAETCPIIIVENFSILTFDTGSAELSQSARMMLDAWLQTAATRTYPTRFQLIGNTDRVGSREANRRLSFRRADAVRRYLMKGGVSGTLISVTAGGEELGLVETEDEIPEPQNRVVQLFAMADEREREHVVRNCPIYQPSR